MSKLNLYTVFHHNLAFSSIPYAHYSYIIEHIYGSLLDMVEEGFKLGLEFTGYTLEVISKVKPGYIDRLKKLWQDGKCEIIGSSYSQAIFPLIPYEVNRKNLVVGLKIYKDLLGMVPRVAYLNEQVYSKALPQLYKEVGYEAIIFDWMNAKKSNNFKEELRYTPVKVIGSGNIRINMIWSDCIAFQKFQRYIWGELDKEEYIDFIKSHLSERKIRNFPLYTSDAEVFDYKPGSLEFKKDGKDMKKMRDLFYMLSSFNWIEIKTPSEILQDSPPEKALTIQTPDYPVRCKKQDKYNLTRWAVTGRDSARMNTQCYRLYHFLSKIKDINSNVDELYKDLLFLWGSDFRTNTTDEKYLEFRDKMGYCLCTVSDVLSEKTSVSETRKRKLPKYSFYEKGRRVTLETQNVKICLLKNKGLAIEKLIFKDVSFFPLFGTIFQDYFKDVSLGSDFYTGHFIMVTERGFQVTDLSATCEVEVEQCPECIIIKNKKAINLKDISCIKEYRIYKDKVKLVYKFYAKGIHPVSFRVGILTLIPEAFDKKSLYYATHNGGCDLEKFYVAGWRISQDEPVNHIVTSGQCLGSTEGLLELGDKEKRVQILTDKSKFYSVPMIHYREIDETFFFRIYNSVCERDELADVLWKGYSEIEFEIKASKTPLAQGSPEIFL